MTSRKFAGPLDIARRQEDDPDIQVGSPSMAPAEAIRAYMKNPGHLLATLRFFAQEEISDTATGVGLSLAALTRYEKGEAAPTLDELARFARHFKADLRLLLDVFGHVKQDASPVSMGIAAQFDGELDKGEKADLRALVKAFSPKAKK